MGLDQFAYRLKSKPETEVDFQIQDESEMVKIHQWRKHPNLEGWMAELYYDKGGEREEFNCTNLQLTWEDILNLERDIKENKLPATTGFYFGASSPNGEEEMVDDLKFVDAAKKALTEGHYVMYSSWW
jgi:hypothetical protein